MAKILKILLFAAILVFHQEAGLFCQVHAAVADFSGNPTTGSVPLTVNFTDQSTGSITSWEWAFGHDNATSTEQNPTHIYNDPGTYTVALTVTGPDGSGTETKSDYISVGQGSLMVTLNPQGAVYGGARWNVDGGAWQDSGVIISNLFAGDHAVYFKDIDGWIPPRMKTVTVVPGQTTEILAVFSQETGLLPDTGQTKCYDNSEEITCPQPGEFFYGQDASFLINPPSYTKLDDQGKVLPDDATEWVMVRDNITQLIWEVKTDDGSIHDKDNKYTWQNAQDVFVTEVNSTSFGGHSDWRVPTIKELASITDLGRYNPAINTDYFPNTLSSNYWSSTTEPYYIDYAWYVGVYYGYDKTRHKGHSYYVRAVRGGQTESLDHLVINGDGTVTDTVTGLMWQQATDGNMNWDAAINHCEGLTLAGYDDWRLPNRRALRSIVDYSRYAPAINTTYFPDTLSDYWSSTTHASRTDNAWGVYFSFGNDYHFCKPYGYHVRAVRGGQNRISGHLVILTPAQGSRWSVGTSLPMTWKPQDIPGNVEISISRQGGKDGTFDIIEESTENDGTFNWAVSGPSSVNCVLKIEPLTDPVKGTVQSLFSILSSELPEAHFSANPTRGPGPLTVNFTDQSAGTITSWEWAFGDDNATSTKQNPTHIYDDPGTYTVSLTVTGPEGTDTETKIDYITALAILYVSYDGVCNSYEPCFTLIQDAIDAADDVSLIMVTEGTYEEYLIIDEPKNLTIQGGWDSTFTTRISYTKIRSMRISEGTVATEYLVIR